MTQASVLSKEGGMCRLNAKRPVTISIEGKKVKAKSRAEGVIEFATTKGARYEVKAN